MRTEITLPEAKPAFEWILGRPVQKVSPKRDHALVQKAFLLALEGWAAGRGEVAAEWRFRLTPPGEAMRLLVPDVVYIAHQRLAGMTREEKQEPRSAPNVVVEVRSPDDRQLLIDEKVRVYLAAGTELVVLVDPRAETAIAIDSARTRHFTSDATFVHPALPGFALALRDVFDRVR